MLQKNRMRDIRTKLGMTQFALCAKSGVSPMTLNFVEKHHHEPRPETKEKLARALGVTVAEVWPEVASDGK